LVEAVLEDAIVSSVNWTEVVQNLGPEGVTNKQLRRALPMIEVIPFLEAHAAVAGELRASTQKRGLSLADRACLVTAMFRDGQALTADRAWEGLDLGIEIRLIR